MGTTRGTDRGGISLEQALLVALLVLVASATLLLLGGSIACLFQQEAGSVGGAGFWASAPAVTVASAPGASDASVAWAAGGTSGPYRVLRGRPGDAGVDMADPSTWTRVGEESYAAPPATGLDIEDGDAVLVVADATRCGIKVQTPAWPAGGSGGNPVPSSSVARYGATFAAYDDLASWGNEKDYVAVLAEDGTQLWAQPAVLDGEPAYAMNAAVSGSTLYVHLRKVSDGSGDGIYAVPGWKDPAAAHDPVPVVLLSDPAMRDLDAYRMVAAAGGGSLLFPGTDSGDGHPLLAAIDPATGARTDLDMAGAPDYFYQGGAALGLDGHLYVLGYGDELYRLDTGADGPYWSVAWTAAGFGVQDYSLLGVDAAGDAFLANNSSTWEFSPAGTATRLPSSASYAPAGAAAFGTDGHLLELDLAVPGDWGTPLATLLDSSAGSAFRTGTFQEPGAGRTGTFGWAFTGLGGDSVAAFAGISPVTGGGSGGSGGGPVGPAAPVGAQAFKALSLAADAEHVLALRNDGALAGAGNNSNGELNIVPVAGPFKAIATGGFDSNAVPAGLGFSVALRTDGTVVAVGNNYSGQCNVGGWSDIVAVAAGQNRTFGVKSDGTVLVAGPVGGESEVATWTGITQVAAGRWHTLGLKADGTVVASGNNAYGQCDVGGWNGIVAVYAGPDTSFGVRADGSVVAAGRNDYGQLGVAGWTDVVDIAASEYDTVVLRSNGRTDCVGRNLYGELDLVNVWSGVYRIAASGHVTMGLKSDGSIVWAGDDSYYGYAAGLAAQVP